MNKFILGIDTSNYTTSAALLDIESGEIKYKKELLPVKVGQAGLRQSEALFHHICRLPNILSELTDGKIYNIMAIGVTNKPRNIEGSYMPCFLAGEKTADSISAVTGIKVHKTSHQINHILAALYSSDKMDLIHKNFVAFHVSGGTTDCLYVSPDDENILSVEQYSSSLDLKAGQAIDRVGLCLGLKFPCGASLEKLAEKSNAIFKEKIKLKDKNCCLSGLENKCQKMLSDGKSKEDIAKYCLYFIAQTIIKMSERVRLDYPNIEIVYAGGVMSDKYIQEEIKSEFENVYFADREYSCDNAIGAALYAYLKEK